MYLLSSLAVGDRIAAGTTVRGVDIGGMTPQAAREALDSGLAAEQSAPLQVQLVAGEDGGPGPEGSQTFELDPASAGLSFDIAATVDRAERPGLLGRVFGREGGEVKAVVRADEERMRNALGELAQASDSALREGAVAFEDGSVRVTEPEPGIALEVDDALDPLRKGFAALGDVPVSLPVSQALPLTDEAEIRRAVDEFAEPAMSAPVVLTAGDARVSVTPEVIGDHLKMTANEAGVLEAELDGEALAEDERLAGELSAASIAPTEAALALEGTEVVVASGGEVGREVVTDSLGEAVLPLLTKTGEDRTGPVETRRVDPRISRANYRELGITEELSSFTVDFDPAPYRTTNIGRAAELIDGSVVLPDELWSFNETVGERTKENGFVEGIIILDGQYQNAQGGGVSAVATTMFNAVFFAGVAPVEYGAHSFYIERYPEGREATVAWGSLDLSFRNDSGHALYILADATDSSVTITFLGTRKYDEVISYTGPRTGITEPGSREGLGDADECVPQPPLEGFDVEVDRVFVSGGDEVGRETFSTRYVPRDEVVCDS